MKSHFLLFAKGGRKTMARKTALLCLLTTLALAFLFITLRSANEEHNEKSRRQKRSVVDVVKKSSRRLSTATYQPLHLQSSIDDASSENDHDASSSSEGYTYLIIHYHKSGHILTQNLRDILIQNDPTIKRNYIDRFPKRDHDTTTKCPHLALHPYTVYVQSSPDFFCDIDLLAEELLTRPNTKRAVKIIHLIRNPYTMAISNYNYHSQDPLPEGENWVKRTNPCAVEDKSSVIYANLFMKTLTSPGAYRLMEYDDFHIIQNICHTLYDKIQSPGFYVHLLNLPPKEGLALATTYLMLGHGGDILRMANNIIKLRQLQTLEQQIHIHQHTLPNQQESRVQVLTLSMDNFIHQPKASILKFLDFVTTKKNNQNVLSLQEREEIASKYEQMFYEKVYAGDEHITSLLSSSKNHDDDTTATTTTNDNNNNETTVVMVSDTMATLEQSLREHVLWGRVLGNIENLVEEALRGVHNWY
jgi:hypothetical protein